MAPLSANTMGLRFMQRGNDNKAATPAPVVTKSKFRPAAPTTAQASTSPAPMELVDSGPGMTIGSSKDLEDGTRVRVQKETSLLAFPMLGSTLSSTVAGNGPTPGRRSFGKFNKQIESLGKPLVSSSAAERTAKAESSSSDSSDEESDSSLDVVETAAPPPRKRPKPSSDTLPISGKNGMLAKGGKVSANGGFMRPKGFEAQQEGGGKKKRKRTKM